MNRFLLIPFVIAANSLLAQGRSDTLISKQYLDSLRHELHNLKSLINRMQFRYRLVVDFKKVDTILYKQDSIVVLHYSNEEKVIRQEVFRLNEKGCNTYLTDRYFDKEGRLAYVEYWDLACGGQVSNGLTGFMQKYERMQYDGNNRLVLLVFHDNRVGARKITYNYDNKGRQTSNIQRIKQYDFWN